MTDEEDLKAAREIAPYDPGAWEMLARARASGRAQARETAENELGLAERETQRLLESIAEIRKERDEARAERDRARLELSAVNGHWPEIARLRERAEAAEARLREVEAYECQEHEDSYCPCISAALARGTKSLERKP